jgi:hypothetical protein
MSCAGARRFVGVQRLLHKLARVSPRGLKARLLREQIARQEAAMLANMKRANCDFTKRVKRHGGRRPERTGPLLPGLLDYVTGVRGERPWL